MPQFSKKKTSKKTTTKRKSRYSGIQAAGNRDPFPAPGDYALAFVESYKTNNGKLDWFHAKFDVAESESENFPEGTRVAYLQCDNTAGLARIKSLCMALAGYTDEDEYDAFDPDGGFLEYIIEGTANEYAGLDVEGRVVFASVTNGNPDGKGGFFLNWAWDIPDGTEPLTLDGAGE